MEEKMMNEKAKTLKIVKIIDEYKVVVNAGINDVIENSTLEVYEPGVEVFDPDTNESLGTLDYIKAKLKVVDVLPKMCICENRDGEKLKSLDSLINLTYMQKVPLNIDSKDISGGFEEISKKIKVGDLVRIID